MALDISKIIQRNLPENCYNNKEIPKTMIFIHHTAGGPNPFNVIDGWKSKADKIATAFVVAGKLAKTTDAYKDGDIVQAFSSKHWGYHLGLKNEHFVKYGLKYKELNSNSIGIEICNWGYLTLGSDGQHRTYVNSIVPKEDVVELTTLYKGHKYYHAYSQSQIQATTDLLVYLCDKYNIPKTYHGDKMFEICTEALSGAPGIWTHTSVRPDKFDCWPHQPLIEKLKSL